MRFLSKTEIFNFCKGWQLLQVNELHWFLLLRSIQRLPTWSSVVVHAASRHSKCRRSDWPISGFCWAARSLYLNRTPPSRFQRPVSLSFVQVWPDSQDSFCFFFSVLFFLPLLSIHDSRCLWYVPIFFSISFIFWVCIFFSMPSTTRLISAKKCVSSLFFLLFPSMIQSCLLKTGRSFCRAWGCHNNGNDILTNRRSAGPINGWDVCQCQNKWLGQKMTVKVGFFREVTDS